MSVQHPEKLVMTVPENHMDQIIDIKTGSFSVGAGVTDGFGNVTSTEASDDHDSHEGALYLFRGIWSHDGGASWHQFGNSVVLGGAANDIRTLSVDATMFSTNGIDAGAGGVYSISASNMGTSGYTITYKILFMARPDQGNISSTPLIQPLRYSSKEKYMKIVLDDVFTAPSSGSTVINHGLGYLPNATAWILIRFDPLTPDSWFMGMIGGGNTGLGFSSDNSNTVDTNNLTFRTHSSVSVIRKVYYRVYSDA